MMTITHREKRMVKVYAAGGDGGGGDAPHAKENESVNVELLPVPKTERSFSGYDMAALWIGLVVCVPAYTLASSLVDLGLTVSQGIAVLAAGSALLLPALLINAHAGAKYGVPFPVLARQGFGVRGANVVAVMRGLVAAGWFGIQTWFGSETIHAMLALAGVVAPAAPWSGAIPPPSRLACFAGFWAMQVAIIVRGMGIIRIVEAIAAPVLIALCSALFTWATINAGGIGVVLQHAATSTVETKSMGVLLTALTGVAGFWSSLVLNISDFSRYSKSQKGQMIGQAVGLPACMALFGFVSIVTTAATPLIFSRVITDPVEVVSLIGGLPTILALFGVLLATLSTNIAANVVAPANALVAVFPRLLGFRGGAFVTAVLGVLIMPWKLVESSSGFFNWLIGYSALLGPIAGVMVAEYVVSGFRIPDEGALFTADARGRYWFSSGYCIPAFIALIAGTVINLPGFLAQVTSYTVPHPIFTTLYEVRHTYIRVNPFSCCSCQLPVLTRDLLCVCARISMWHDICM